YCFTPMRYVWEFYNDYFGKGRAGTLTRIAMFMVAPYLRRWDVRATDRVHHFVTSAHNVAARIVRHYHRSAEVIHAPVDTQFFRISQRDEGYYLVVSALVPYKRVDLAIEAFNRTGKRLLIAGKGPDFQKLKAMAEPNIELLGWQSDENLKELYANCRAFVFPGEEDFGITPLEAMASGKPVIAFAKGGALETVVDKGNKQTGVFFHEQTAEALIEAVRNSEKKRFNPSVIRKHAEKFSRERFKSKLKAYIEEKVRQHFKTA
ncbi:MAG: glycosyltransferase, partial [Ignavibacteriales bacterium]|nr:glycosyltransferase [Ignavibacteriales bacterium]